MNNNRRTNKHVLCCFMCSGFHCVVLSSTEKPDMTIFIIAAVVVLALVLIAVVGFLVYRRMNGEKPKQKDLLICFFTSALILDSEFMLLTRLQK